MKIRSLKVSGLYSYGNETEITIPDISIITGANNAGKSNLFRVIDLVISSLTGLRKHLRAVESFDNNGSPWVELRLTLTTEETDQIINYLSFYETGSSSSLIYVPLDKELLRKELDEIRIKINWKMRYLQYGKEASDIEFSFEKIGVTLFMSGIYDRLMIKMKESGSNIQQLFRDWLTYLASKRQKVSTKHQFSTTAEKLHRAFEAGESVNVAISWMPFQSNATSEPGALQTLEEIITYINDVEVKRGNGILFLELIGIIIEKSVYHASGKRMFQPGKLDYTQKLQSDGSNLSQFLYNLKMSASLEERDRYDAIRRKFEEMMMNDSLSFDVIIEYEEEEIEKDTLTNKKIIRLTPHNSRVVIIDTKQKKQFLLDQAGSGIGEIIFLLSLGYGLKNSVILLDEPAINLSPPQIGKTMRVLLGLDGKNSGANISPKSNQFLIITHSAELARVLLFEKGVELLHIAKREIGSEINHLDDETRKWFQEKSTTLRHQIDTRMFFGKRMIFTEGESDTTFLTEIALNFADEDKSLDINTENVIIVNVDGKYNFPKYRRLANSLDIPHVILGDKDVLGESRNDMKAIFESCSLITANGIEENDNKVFVIKNGKLETLMEELDADLYLKTRHRLEANFGKDNVPKSIMASEYVKEIMNTKPEALFSIRELLRKIIMFQ